MSCKALLSGNGLTTFSESEGCFKTSSATRLANLVGEESAEFSCRRFAVLFIDVEGSGATEIPILTAVVVEAEADTKVLVDLAERMVVDTFGLAANGVEASMNGSSLYTDMVDLWI